MFRPLILYRARGEEQDVPSIVLYDWEDGADAGDNEYDNEDDNDYDNDYKLMMTMMMIKPTKILFRNHNSEEVVDYYDDGENGNDGDDDGVKGDDHDADVDDDSHNDEGMMTTLMM